jgi:hypothetical protein
MLYKILLFIIIIASIPSRITIIEVKAQTPIEIIKQVADEKGIAQHDLLGISKRESSLCKVLIGDGGKSKGCFHINTAPEANPQAISIIGNIKKEAEWVADRLLSYGYPEKRTLAFAKYNAPNAPDLSNNPKSYANLVKKDVEWVKKNLSSSNK